VPLPEEPQGESVAYDRDGRSLLTVSEKATAARPVILRYPAPAAPSPTGKRGGCSAPPKTGSACAPPAARRTASPAAVAAARKPRSVAVGVVGLAALAAAALLAVAVAAARRHR
jgi:hypothetical protein